MRLFDTYVPLASSVNGVSDNSDAYVAYIPLCSPAFTLTDGERVFLMGLITEQMNAVTVA